MGYNKLMFNAMDTAMTNLYCQSCRVSVPAESAHSHHAILAGYIYCEFCDCNTIATKLMPQSSDCGKTVDLVPACEAHQVDWWGGADWDGRHLEQVIDKDTVDPRLVQPRKYRKAKLNGERVLVRNPYVIFSPLASRQEVVYAVYEANHDGDFRGFYFGRALSGLSE